jgi:hypothetical protein
MMFLEETKDPDLVDAIHPCSSPPLLSCCASLVRTMCCLRRPSSCCSLSRRSFQLPVVKLYPMLDAFCSSEFFRETLDGARRVYLN